MKTATTLDEQIAKLKGRGMIIPDEEKAKEILLDKYIRDAPLETKIKLIGSIFEDKIEFDGEKYRTNSYNKVLDLIFQQTNELRGDKKRRKNFFFLQLSTQTRI